MQIETKIPEFDLLQSKSSMKQSNQASLSQIQKEKVINENIYLDTKNSFKTIDISKLIMTTGISFVANDITFSTFIQTTSKCRIIANGCTFTPSSNFPEIGIKLQLYSTATFRNCTFRDFDKCAVIDHASNVEFIDCSFIQNHSSSVFVSDNSTAEFTNCVFDGCDKIPIFVNNKSNATIKQCRFNNCDQASVFALNSSIVTGLQNEFSNSKSGITISDHSILILTDSSFNNITNSCIQSSNDSEINIQKCTFSMIGQGIVLKNTKGTILKSQISNAKQNGVVILGKSSNPLLSEISIQDCGGFNVAIRDLASPQIISSTFNNDSNYNFSISDQAIPLISHNSITGTKTAIFVFNEASPLVYCNKITSPTIIESTVWGLPFYIQNENDLTTPQLLQSRHGQVKLVKIPNEMTKFEINTIKGTFRAAFYDNFKTVKYDIPQFSELEQSASRIHCHSNQCQKCHKEKATMVITPCGHCVYCQDCANSIHCNVDKCPICNCTISMISKLYDIENNQCVVCMDSKCDSIFLPCGHKCCCKSCAEKTHQMMKRCPLCNQKILSIKKYYGI